LYFSLPFAFAVSACVAQSLEAEKAGAPIVTMAASHGKLAAAVDRAILAAASPDFGGAVTIVQNGKLVLSAGYGYADREKRIPFRTNTIAQIGSISKSLTAAAIADLESQGKVDPNSAISVYLPELKNKSAGAVTVRQLLTHTGGYPEYCGDDFEASSSSDMLSDCFAPLDAKPGDHSYSNAGYSALALIVERASGKTLENYLKDRIVGPLGMRDTAYEFAGASRKRFAAGYLNGVNQGVISDRIEALHGAYWNLKGNGGVQSSSDDMIRWGRDLFEARSPSTVMAKKLSDSANWASADEPGVHYGYGFYIVLRTDGSMQRISHGGSDGIFSSLLRWYPEEKILIYLVGNSGEDDVKKVISAAVGAVKAGAPVRE
jgi:CubicO group peptidase (beta-lactamase class C family)